MEADALPGPLILILLLPVLSRFSHSLSKEIARELALALINFRSASALFRTSRHPFEMKEKAFSA
jgi:hypothetical protein